SGAPDVDHDRRLNVLTQTLPCPSNMRRSIRSKNAAKSSRRSSLKLGGGGTELESPYSQPVPRPLMKFCSERFESGSSSRSRSHPCVSLHGCLEGPISLWVDRKEHKLDAGMFCVLPKGTSYRWENRTSIQAATMTLLVDTDSPGHWPVCTGMAECCRD